MVTRENNYSRKQLARKSFAEYDKIMVKRKRGRGKQTYFDIEIDTYV